MIRRLGDQEVVAVLLKQKKALPQLLMMNGRDRTVSFARGDEKWWFVEFKNHKAGTRHTGAATDQGCRKWPLYLYLQQFHGRVQKSCPVHGLDV